VDDVECLGMDEIDGDMGQHESGSDMSKPSGPLEASMKLGARLGVMGTRMILVSRSQTNYAPGAY